MALAKRLNLKKDHGTVIGDGRFAYDQDGQLYDAQKRAVDSNGNLMPMVEAPEEMEAQSVQVRKGRDIDPEDETDDDKPIDLAKWRQGLVKAPWVSVVAAIQTEFGNTVGSKKEAYALIDAKYGAGGDDADAEASENTEA